jgi:hypothetical protein
MFSLLRRSLPSGGRVLFRGVIPPPWASIRWPSAATVTALDPTDDFAWRAEVEHPDWGRADVCAFRQGAPALPFIEFTTALTAAERAEALLGHATIGVRATTSAGNVLRDRKRLLRWLRTLLEADGVVAIDDGSLLPWSRAMLDDELGHDAPLDVEALYTLHAVAGDGGRVTWLHTHGLAEIGAFDFDILEPSDRFMLSCADPCRSLACAGLEGLARPGDTRYALAHPGGDVGLVPVADFVVKASTRHRALRTEDEAHGGNRVVLCEPTGWLSSWRQAPRPSRFLSTTDSDRVMFRFSEDATALGAERAQQTVPVLRTLAAEFSDLQLPILLKLAYETDRGSREHLWFEGHELGDDHADATLVNAPFDIAAMREGDRGVHPYERLSDWQILSPVGSMSPRNVSAARLIRERRAEIAALVRGSPTA